MIADAIGEIIPRFLWIRDDIKESKSLNVFIPVTDGTLRFANKEVMKQIQKQNYLVDAEEIPFWIYVIYKHSEEINISEVDKYRYRNDAPIYKIDKDTVEFDVKELEREQQQLKEIGVSRPYVCFLARTAKYNLNTIGKDFDYDYRNMNFLDYQRTIDYLKKSGISSVRMGRSEMPILELRNCIDYAGMCANDFGDLALIHNCQFMVSSNCGAYLMAYLFSKPILIVNMLGYSLGYGAFGYTGTELFIPQKVYSVIQGRLLSISEIMDVEHECYIFGENYKERGIRFIGNTQEEICEAVEEMQKRLKGTWVDTPEDQIAYEKYLEYR